MDGVISTRVAIFCASLKTRLLVVDDLEACREQGRDRILVYRGVEFVNRMLMTLMSVAVSSRINYPSCLRSISFFQVVAEQTMVKTGRLG